MEENNNTATNGITTEDSDGKKPIIIVEENNNAATDVITTEDSGGQTSIIIMGENNNDGLTGDNTPDLEAGKEEKKDLNDADRAQVQIRKEGS